MPGNEAKLTDRSSEVRGLGYDHAAIENKVCIDYCITGCINSRVLCDETCGRDGAAFCTCYTSALGKQRVLSRYGDMKYIWLL